MHLPPSASIPSPSDGVWEIGLWVIDIPIRAYALAIILGVIAAVWVGEWRWRARGGSPGVIVDVAVWAVPFGLIGGRIYHVITDWQLYFGDDAKPGERNDPLGAIEVWDGGLSVWGAIAFGAFGAWWACRKSGVSFPALADVAAPGVALAQAIGRWGNYFNQELYGKASDLPWAVEIDKDHRPGRPPEIAEKYANVETYHPTYLYESLWCVGVAILVIWAGKKYRLSHGRTFALYVAAYTVGRFWIEALRIDEAHEVAGLRINDWVSVAVFLAAVGYLYVNRKKNPDDEVLETRPAPGVEPDGAGDVDDEAEQADNEAKETPAEPSGKSQSGKRQSGKNQSSESQESGAEPADSGDPEADAKASGSGKATADGKADASGDAAEESKAAEPDEGAEAGAAGDGKSGENGESAEDGKAAEAGDAAEDGKAAGDGESAEAGEASRSGKAAD